MRLESTGRDETFKVWMTDDELETLRRSATSHRDDMIIQLGGYVGLRAFEIPQVQPQHIKRTDDGSHYHLRIPKGKDTKHGRSMPRDVYLPHHVERDLHRYITTNSIPQDQSVIDLSTRGVRSVVERTAARAAVESDDPDYQYVSSHDLRRRFAQRLLVDNHMNPRLVMAVGGWSSFQAIEPYLNAPTQTVINEAFEAAGLSRS